MKPAHFIYSRKQQESILTFAPNREVNQVFVNGKFVPYTEINDTGDSNWDDANHLGIHPSRWVKCCGVIQDSGLKKFINKGVNR